MLRTTSQIRDIVDASIWVMDPATLYFDEARPLPDNKLYRVRQVPGVAWAVPLFKGTATMRTDKGNFRAITLFGLDDTSLVGAPPHMLLGRLEDLSLPDAVIIDRDGYKLLYPGEPYKIGREIEMNERRGIIVGICKISRAFNANLVGFTRYSNALDFVGQQRNNMSFVLAQPDPGLSPEVVAQRIKAKTGLMALDWNAFGWKTIWYYMKHTGIPINFGTTIIVGIIVGMVVAGQTFYIFTIENLKQFGALKAIGVTNGTLLRMILLQASIVAFIGYSIGVSMCSFFIMRTTHLPATRGFTIPWQVFVFTAIIIFSIVLLASLASLRKVLVLEPAIVFRG